HDGRGRHGTGAYNPGNEALAVGSEAELAPGWKIERLRCPEDVGVASGIDCNAGRAVFSAAAKIGGIAQRRACRVQLRYESVGKIAPSIGLECKPHRKIVGGGSPGDVRVAVAVDCDAHARVVA